jgi:hypothetical protein
MNRLRILCSSILPVFVHSHLNERRAEVFWQCPNCRHYHALFSTAAFSKKFKHIAVCESCHVKVYIVR